jgi:pilus assembly protein Flp/PilA
MRKMIVKFVSSTGAATAIEYGLLAGLIAVAIISGVTMVGTSLSTTFSTVQAAFK